MPGKTPRIAHMFEPMCIAKACFCRAERYHAPRLAGFHDCTSVEEKRGGEIGKSLQSSQ